MRIVEIEMSPTPKSRHPGTNENVVNPEDPMVGQLFWLAHEIVHRSKPASPMDLGALAWQGFWAEFRGVTRQMLEAAVLDDVRLAEYEAWLTTLPQDRIDASNRSFPEVEQDRVVAEGLEFLDTDGLVRLALAPKALAAITDRVRQGEMPAWDAALERLIERDIATGVVVVPESGPFVEVAKLLYEQSRTPAERVTLEGRLSHLDARQLYQLFEERRHLEAEAIHRLFNLEPIDRSRVTNALQCNIDEARDTEGPEQFAKLDVAFHVMLGGAASGCQVAANEAVRFLTDHGDWAVLTLAERRALVCDEHQAIVNALSDNNSDAAMGSVLAHLSAAQRRWLPGYKGYIARKNMDYFEKMRGGAVGDFLCVASIDITPVEMLVANRSAEGREAAAAVRRGATLVYLRPSQRLLDSWVRKKLIDACPGREQETVAEFATFQTELAKELAGTGCYESADEAASVVNRQVLLFCVGYDPLFFLTRSCGVLGYYRYSTGVEMMTHRKPSAEEAAWPEIVAGAKSDPTTRTFLALVDRALKRLRGADVDTAKAALAIRNRLGVVTDWASRTAGSSLGSSSR